MESLALGAVLAVAGLLTRAWAAGQLHKNAELSVGGPYAFTRNPLYLGSLFLGLGITFAGGLPVFVLVFLAFFFWLYSSTMAKEEKVLEGLFGSTYVAYRNSVPRLLPRLRPYRPADTGAPVSFSPKMYVLNKEWEATLGAAAGFAYLVARLKFGF